MANNRPGRNGRGSYERHVRIPHGLSGSPAWRALRGSSIKVYIALARFNLGDNNGDLFFSIEMGMKETGLARNTVADALKQLEEHGFIAAVARGYFKQKGGPATRWRLTHLPAPNCKPSIPTNDWQLWRPACGNKSRSQILNDTVSKSEIRSETHLVTVSGFETEPGETPLVSADRVISKSDAQVVCHLPSSGTGCCQPGNIFGNEGGTSGNVIDATLLDQLRTRALSTTRQMGVGGLTRLARAVPMHKGTLSKFLSGRGLKAEHYHNLLLALADRPPLSSPGSLPRDQQGTGA